MPSNTTPEKKSNRLLRFYLLSAMVFGGLLFSVSNASASIITDIPQGVNEALFDGASLFAARAILTASVTMSAAMALAMLKMPPSGIFISLLTVLAALTAIGWAEVTIMVAAIFITAAMYGRTMIDWIAGHKEA